MKQHVMYLDEDLYYDVKFNAIKHDSKLSDFFILLLERGLEDFKKFESEESELE